MHSLSRRELEIVGRKYAVKDLQRLSESKLREQIYAHIIDGAGGERVAREGGWPLFLVRQSHEGRRLSGLTKAALQCRARTLDISVDKDYAKDVLVFKILCWSEDLAVAEYVINSTVSASTGYEPNQILFVRHPERRFLLDSLVDCAQGVASSNGDVKEFLQQYQTRVETVKSRLEAATAKQKKYYDRKRREAKGYIPGAFAYLSTEHLSIARHKLDDKFVGPFQILESISPVSVRLKIKRAWGINDTFHVEQLKLYRGPLRDAEAQQTELLRREDGSLGTAAADQRYEIEEIEAVRGQGRAREYLVKWAGFSERTWEPRASLLEARYMANPRGRSFSGASTRSPLLEGNG